MSQLERLGELVENILAMSMERRKTMLLKPENINLAAFVKELAEARLTCRDKEVRIETDISADIEITADRTHLANIVNNLMDNAIKYSGQSVRIKIHGNAEYLTIADNGIGIPAKHIPFLFDKFYRVPHGNVLDVRGFGIGLYYIKNITERMGWSVSVKSRVGEGSVFTIKFRRDGK